MPIFEYTCHDCGHQFEILVLSSQANNLQCPHCQSKKITKRFSSFGIGGGSNRLQTSSSACQSCSTKNCSTCKP
ncbi:MAG TPA: zinc ribbon domain-containing protein [Candidatus Aminicenantes bacterium]|nr:zinc ribbon domain-containing protein [Candidatus Aminicenantes bacterium]